ncbi:HEPN domain-containing protein [Rhodopirellula baltica]|uniref:HEPN domain-containing protein n=1 Tax=Rhodopirellula baltica TaxID=265606 RepID=UPI001EEF33CE|nr:HEPN domain-containing protein [Rhodopirellula baltica]
MQPADTSHLDLETTLSACTQPDDIAVAAAFIPRVTAQLKITAPTPKELAAAAWNSSWDALMLSAFFRSEIGFNLQSDTPADAISANSTLMAINLHMRGLTNSSPYRVTDDDVDWIACSFANARKLLENDRFQTAVHCLATYRWHSMARVQLAILWAGIEGMFGASTEIRFRISLYIARFLHPDDANKRQVVFDAVKRLYNSRSAAVHGSNIKGDTASIVSDSAEILRNLLRRCTDRKSMPDENELVP